MVFVSFNENGNISSFVGQVSHVFCKKSWLLYFKLYIANSSNSGRNCQLFIFENYSNRIELLNILLLKVLYMFVL